MFRPWSVAAVAAVMLACFVPAARGAIVVPTDFSDATIVGQLDEPRALAFLPDGRLLFVEQRTGRVRMVVNGHLAAQDPLLTISEVYSNGYERGLQSVAVDPAWPARPFLYFFHNGLNGVNKLVRYTASGALTDPNAESLTLSNRVIIIPDVRDNDANHNAGCLRFAPDGMLFLGLGEDEVWCDAQDSTSFRGCILRLDVSRIPAVPAGAIPRALITPAAGNPLSSADSNAKLVYAYGLRNPWSFGVDANNGTVYTADVGEADYEEINEIRPGGNYGWPYREGPRVLARANCPEPGGSGNPANGYLPPIAYYGRDAALHAAVAGVVYRAPSGGAFAWPVNHRGSVFWGDYYDGWLQRLVRDTTGAWVVAPPVAGQPTNAYWGTGFGSMVDFAIGPDGDLWWLRQYDDDYNPVTGSLHRVRWNGVQVGVPPAVHVLSFAARPNPFEGSAQVTFTLAAPARVRLAVYDLAGRHVRRLLDGAATAGETRLAWDGRGDGGTAVAPGLYLARLQVNGALAGTVRLLRVR